MVALIRHAPNENLPIAIDRAAPSRLVAALNPVNTVGIMGRGLARTFAARFPAILPPYTAACAAGAFMPGQIQPIRLDRTTGARDPNGKLIVVNVATKRHWREPSELPWIETALAKVARFATEHEVEVLLVPKLGCGLGGLDWADVGRIVERELAGLARQGCEVVVFGEAPANDEPIPDDRPKPVLEATMTFRFGGAKRPEITAATTFDAILAGERTATTRFASWQGSERWAKLPPGAVVRFHDRADRRGRALDVTVVAVAVIDLATMSDADLERWSVREGWTAAAGRNFAEKHGGRAWQIVFRDPILRA